MESNKNDQVSEEQRELQELIELKKRKQAAAEHPETIEPPQKQEEVLLPKTFKQKWANYWYHYKLVTWLAVFAVFVAGWFVKDIFFGPKYDLVVDIASKYTKWANYWYHYKLVTWLAVFAVFVAGWFVKDIFFGPKYDLVVDIASKYTFSAINENMGEDAAAYAEDYDGNGKRAVQVNEMQVNYDGTGETNQSTMVGEQKILAILNAGEDLLFILDSQTYDQLIGSNAGNTIFADLSALYPDIRELVQGDKVLLQQTELGKKWRMNAVDSELYLCVRKIEGNVKDNEKTRAKYEDALNFVDHVVKGEPAA